MTDKLYWYSKWFVKTKLLNVLRIIIGHTHILNSVSCVEEGVYTCILFGYKKLKRKVRNKVLTPSNVTSKTPTLLLFRHTHMGDPTPTHTFMEEGVGT